MGADMNSELLESTPMPIAIPDEFKTFVSHGVASGRFRTEEEAVCEGLNLLREREQH